jgi:ABC-type multidrug transport system ATPase subunit
MCNLLEIDSVIKTYSDNRVLTDIYLKCETGDIIGLLGRNGTGKSTLLKILFGSEQGETKFIRIDGKVHSRTYQTKGEIAYLPQDSFLPHQLTVRKTIELFLDKEAIHFFKQDEIIGRLINNKINYLSGGELRYLEIKLLLNSSSKFLLLDEPFNGVAPVVVDALKEMIKAHSKNKGIILTDHDYRNVLDVANRYCLLADGSLKTISTLEDLIKWGYLPAGLGVNT